MQLPFPLLERNQSLVDGIANNDRRVKEVEKPDRSAQDYLGEKTSIQERLKDAKREWAERKTPDKPAPQKKSL